MLFEAMLLLYHVWCVQIRVSFKTYGCEDDIEMFYLNSTLNFGIPPVLVFQLHVYSKVDILLSGLTAQQKGTTA